MSLLESPDPVPTGAELRRSRRRLAVWFVLTAMLVVGITTFLQRRLPSTVIIAAGPRMGLYWKFATALAQRLEARTGHPVRLLETQGALDNRDLLLGGKAHLGILQAGAAPATGLAALAPLYPEVVHVLVRANSGIRSLQDLTGRRVSLGGDRSGTRVLAELILKRYGVAVKSEGSHERFQDLLTDSKLDAAVMTTGILNPDLGGVLRTGKFRLLSLPNAAALALHVRHLSAYTIPPGALSEMPSVPLVPAETVATTAVLVSPAGAPDELVHAALDAMYEGDLVDEIPNLTSRAEARSWSGIHLHPAARAYFNPEEAFDTVSKFLQSASAGKELLVAMFAGVYVLWDRWRRRLRRKDEAEMRAAKERLDHYVSEAVRIERAQIGAWDPPTLRACLDEITLLKLDALESLTHEVLRGDRLFLIFLTQCSGLVDKIQLKLALGTRMPAPPDEG